MARNGETSWFRSVLNGLHITNRSLRNDTEPGHTSGSGKIISKFETCAKETNAVRNNATRASRKEGEESQKLELEKGLVYERGEKMKYYWALPSIFLTFALAQLTLHLFAGRLAFLSGFYFLNVRSGNVESGNLLYLTTAGTEGNPNQGYSAPGQPYRGYHIALSIFGLAFDLGLVFAAYNELRTAIMDQECWEYVEDSFTTYKSQLAAWTLVVRGFVLVFLYFGIMCCAAAVLAEYILLQKGHGFALDGWVMCFGPAYVVLLILLIKHQISRIRRHWLGYWTFVGLPNDAVHIDSSGERVLNGSGTTVRALGSRHLRYKESLSEKAGETTDKIYGPDALTFDHVLGIDFVTETIRKLRGPWTEDEERRVKYERRMNEAIEKMEDDRALIDSTDKPVGRIGLGWLDRLLLPTIVHLRAWGHCRSVRTHRNALMEQYQVGDTYYGKI